MSEFERARKDSAGTDAAKQRFPKDFTHDEATFASQLHEVFPLEQEVLPPHFIQTVMEDGWQTPTPSDFEQKMIDDVFRRLDLPRDLPPVAAAPLTHEPPTAAKGWRPFARVGRTLAASLVAVALMMTVSVVVANPSFAAGLALVLSHTGARQVDHYPTSVVTTSMRSPDSASLDPNFLINWLGQKADKYIFQGAHTLPAEDWSNGPIVEVQYVTSQPTQGTGLLDIREFQVSSKYTAVMQTVQTGSASWLQVNGIPAVYIDGMWMDRAMGQRSVIDGHVWQFGGRSELMLEKDGIVFWIVGDQKDGANQAELAKLASMLTATSNRILRPNPLTLHGLGENFIDIFQKPQGFELLYLVPRGAALTSNTGIVVASDNTPY